MIIVRIKGGLGNQLFQYAAGYALSKRLNQSLAIDASYFDAQDLRSYKLEKLLIPNADPIDTDRLPIPIKILKNKAINKGLRKSVISTTFRFGNTTYLLENKSDIIDEFFSVDNSNIYLDGYYQSELYFHQYRHDIVQNLRKRNDSPDDAEMIKKMMLSVNSVAVHIRHGDFLDRTNRNKHHYILDLSYYLDAMKYIKERIHNPVFFFFSDDIQWVKNTFKDEDNSHFVKIECEDSDLEELFLMSNCKNIIAANSTFSWWASWLINNEDAIHIVPQRRYGNAKMIPADWIKL